MGIKKKLFNIERTIVLLFPLIIFTISSFLLIDANSKLKEKRIEKEIKYYYPLLDHHHSNILRDISNLNNLNKSITVREALLYDEIDGLSLLKNIEIFNKTVNKLGQYCIKDNLNESSLLINDFTHISRIQELEKHIIDSCQKAEKAIVDFNEKEKQRILKNLSNS